MVKNKRWPTLPAQQAAVMKSQRGKKWNNFLILLRKRDWRDCVWMCCIKSRADWFELCTSDWNSLLHFLPKQSTQITLSVFLNLLTPHHPSRLLIKTLHCCNTYHEVTPTGVSFSDGEAESHHRRHHRVVQRPLTVHIVPDAVEDQ